jgi:hypothetical protein
VLSEPATGDVPVDVDLAAESAVAGVVFAVGAAFGAVAGAGGAAVLAAAVLAAAVLAAAVLAAAVLAAAVLAAAAAEVVGGDGAVLEMMPRICCSFVAARGVTSRHRPTRDDTQRAGDPDTYGYSVPCRVVWYRVMSRDHDLDTGAPRDGARPVAADRAFPAHVSASWSTCRCMSAVCGPMKPLTTTFRPGRRRTATATVASRQCAVRAVAAPSGPVGGPRRAARGRARATARTRVSPRQRRAAAQRAGSARWASVVGLALGSSPCVVRLVIKASVRCFPHRPGPLCC